MTRIKPRLILLPLLTLTLLAGCGGKLFESKKVDYKSAGVVPMLEIPPDLTTPGQDEATALPGGSETFSRYIRERKGLAGAASDPVILPNVGKMKIERDGNQRWLVVPGNAQKLWPLVKTFWQENGFIINIEQPETGVMETDWAEDRAKIPQDFLRNAIGGIFDDAYSTAERDKYRTRLEQGTEPDTTEIFISHRGMYETYINEGKEQTRWQPRAADPELEAEMLRKLMVRLGADETVAKNAVTAEPGQDRARIAKTADGNNALEIAESFDRAWRRVGLALDRAGFTVEDRDRTQGLYFVRYIDPAVDAKAKSGDESWVSKLAFWRSKPDKTKIENQSRYRVQVKASGDNSQVQVLTAEGGLDKSDTAKKILSILQEQLK
ncbi:MAG: outer membrane protein assembly factor BamC [Georgfuchsia sp.]